MSKDELLENLRIQAWLLSSSMRSYDQGNHPEVLRLAVTIRVLVHDTASSTSLLRALGVKYAWSWPASGAGIDPVNLAPTTSLTYTAPGGPQGMEFLPRDEENVRTKHKAMTFEDWWNVGVIKDGEGEEFSRRNLILMLANKAGGAHVDALAARDAALRTGGSLGWMVSTETETYRATISAVEPSVRTIAEEVAFCLNVQAPSLYH